MALSLPPGVRQAVGAATGAGDAPDAGIRDVRAVGGGCISRAARLETRQGPMFLKWHERPPAGLFAAEASGLRRLAATDTVRVPRVHAHGDAPGAAFILMEWIEPSASERGAALADAGRRLARLHARRGLEPGLDEDNLIGTLRQPNGPPDDGRWLTFFRERRLMPLAAGLPASTRRRLETLRLEDLLDEPEGGAALLHGDLWGGNLVCEAGGRGCLVDPAVYAGHPEVDLAMTRLFGGFGPTFEAAYQEVAGPLPPGFDERAALLNLYPLLVHVHLFGGAYASQVDDTLRRFC